MARMAVKQVNYWKIAPGANASEWEICRDSGCILLGWAWIKGGDYSIHKDEPATLKALGPKDGKGAARSINWFARVIQTGDTVVANDGKRRAVGLAELRASISPQPLGRTRIGMDASASGVRMRASSIVQRSWAAMLLGDDVIQLKRQWIEFLGNTAILTAEASTPLHLIAM